MRNAGSLNSPRTTDEAGRTRIRFNARTHWRNAAQAQGLPVVGLLGVVLMAKRHGLVSSARSLLLRLDQEAGVYLASDVKETALKTVGEGEP